MINLHELQLQNQLSLVIKVKLCAWREYYATNESPEEQQTSNTCHDLNSRELRQYMNFDLLPRYLKRHLESTGVVFCEVALLCPLN